MPLTFLMLPPQGDRTREWARRLSEAHPELEIIAPETMEGAEQAITGAEFGSEDRDTEETPL